MNGNRMFARLGGVLLLALAACGPGGKEEPAVTLTLTTQPRKIDDRGQTAIVTASVVDAEGKPGTGDVLLAAAAGAFEGGGKQTTVTLEGGRAKATFSCAASLDPGCEGAVRLEAQWQETTTATTIQVEPLAGGDAGAPDAGAPDAGAPDAGAPDGGSTFTMSMDAGTRVIYLGVGDSTEVFAQLKYVDGGVPPDQTVEFSTTLGQLMRLDGGSPGTSLTEQTGNDGMARVRFTETGAAGTANIRAVGPQGLNREVAVEVTTIQRIQYVSTTCNGAPCTIMGLRFSGFNELAHVTFKIADASNRPVKGVQVNFSITNPPSQTTVSPSGITDAQGLVTAFVSSGVSIGSFVVHAEIPSVGVSVQSNTIGIRGVRPSNKGFAFYCAKANIPAFVSTTAGQPNPLKLSCLTKVVDRFGNAVGTGTTVNFLSEAGTIEQSKATKAFSTTGTNADEGTATVVFDTVGTFPPVDVSPLDAATQYPRDRTAEPSRPDGSLQRNPRDGLVTVVAYVRGEEYFFDTNTNGTRDVGEQFIDQGEVFVDADDDGEWEPGEVYVDDSPANGSYDGPNGVWDRDVTVWSETRVLYTERPSWETSTLTPNPFADLCSTSTSGLPRGQSTDLFYRFADHNYNMPDEAMTLAVSSTGSTRGTVDFVGGTPNPLDSFGFGIERLLLNADTNGQCTASVPRCVWRYLFYDWSSGYSGWVRVTNTSTSGVCEVKNVAVKATLLGATLQLGSSGGIQ